MLNTKIVIFFGFSKMFTDIARFFFKIGLEK